ncbi:MAG: hypothetical protein AAF943_16375 [Pseudomonadota bacterium]
MELHSKKDRHKGFAPRPGDFAAGRLSRLSGPGGFYCLANIVGLSALFLVSLVATWGQPFPVTALLTHFFAAPGAVWLFVSLVTFLISGEVYHQAYQSADGPDRTGIVWGDFLSGVAAVLLTIAMIRLGDTLLACGAGVMLFIGKFGSAALAIMKIGNPQPLYRAARLCVLASRVPSVLSLVLGMFASVQAGAAISSIFLPLALVVTFALCFYADLLLLKQQERQRSD